MEVLSLDDSEYTTENMLEVVPNHGFFLKLVVLILICLVSTGLSFAMDGPAAMQDNIMINMNISSFQYNLLYTLYSFPNIVAVFFGGLIIDYYLGIRWSTFLFCLMVAIGQLCFCLGAYFGLFWLMGLGRFIFGLGGESLSCATCKYGVLWFKGKMLAVSFSIQICIMKVASTLNMAFLKRFYSFLSLKMGLTYTEQQILGITFALGTVVTVFSLLCSICLNLIDKSYRNEIKNPNGDEIKNSALKNLLENFKDLSTFNFVFWLLTAICVTGWSASQFFSPLAIGFIENKYLRSSIDSSTLLSMCSLTGMVSSPFIGVILGVLGNDVTMMNLSMLGLILSHSLFSFSFVEPIYLLIIIGVSNNLLSCTVFPGVAYVIPEKYLGTAYGFMQCIQNAGLAISPMIAGKILDNYGYFCLEVTIVLILGATFFLTISLYYFDLLKSGRILNMSANERSKVLKITN